jgi:hypothetical protein
VGGEWATVSNLGRFLSVSEKWGDAEEVEEANGGSIQAQIFPE